MLKRETALYNFTKIMNLLREHGTDPVRKTFDVGFGLMKNRLQNGQHDPVGVFMNKSIPSTLLFTAQVEHRERQLANEICWQQWKNDYYYSKYPERKDKAGYGPGAMVVAKP